MFKKLFKHFIICCFFSIIVACAVTMPVAKINKNDEKYFLSMINYYVGRTPNELYSDWGKPQEYTTDLDKKGNIINGKIYYEKVYNFALQQYDCMIIFTTDATQKFIKKVSYSSDLCFYLSQYKQ